MKSIDWAEKAYLPDSFIRAGIRKLLRRRLEKEWTPNIELREERKQKFFEILRSSPIAIEQDRANEQHYEVDSRFYSKVLGPHLKYSSGLWNRSNNLHESELEMLEAVCQRAELDSESVNRILDLGCGWGSFCLFAAARYPDKEFVAVSNSKTQKQFIEAEANKRGLTNLKVETHDIRSLDWQEKFDRIVSVEMFEHMRNYEALLKKLRRFLNPGGKLFVHIFCHRNTPYFFEVEGEDDWMAQYFFSGGVMPSFDLLLYFPEDLKIEKSWAVNGMNYSKTCEAWLEEMDQKRPEIMSVFDEIYGGENAGVWFQRWRMFFMACSELFRFRDGEEWFVAHYLLSSRG